MIWENDHFGLLVKDCARFIGRDQQQGLQLFFGNLIFVKIKIDSYTIVQRKKTEPKVNIC